MIERQAEAQWIGDLKSGRGHLKTGSGAVESPYSFQTRFEDNPGTNPEELLAAAHAGCYAMAFSKMLSEAGHAPELIKAQARIALEKGASGFAITRSRLSVEARVPGIGEEDFARLAEQARTGCLVSKVFKGLEIELEAKLLAGAGR